MSYATRYFTSLVYQVQKLVCSKKVQKATLGHFQQPRNHGDLE